MAHEAAFGFNVGALLGGFEAGVDYALVNGFAASGNAVEGRPGGIAGGFAFSFAPQKTDCEQFVDELYDYALEAYGVNNSLGTGRDMALRAKNYYGRSKDAQGNNRFGIGGFKTELYENQQGADVYKHILGQAGAILIGDNWLNPLSHLTSEPYIYAAQPGAKPAATGTELARANLARDRQQINDPQHGLEAIVEVRNDMVGEEIGNMILGTVNNKGSIHALRQKIFDKLCNK